MDCLTPFFKKLENLGPGESPGPFPCGKCYACVMRRISGWHFRLSSELKVCKSATFLTLTYNSDYVPILDNGLLTLNKHDLQKFFKRLRKLDNNIKYYAVGEYGSRFDRPHYHAILFNADNDNIVSSWCAVEKRKLTSKPLGNVFFGDVNESSIGYVAGYVQKSFYSVWNDARFPPFACMSKYLGINYLTPAVYNWHKKDLDKRCLIQLDDRKIAMPRYFKNLIYNEMERKRIAHFTSFEAMRSSLDRMALLVETYGDRAFEVDFEQKKILYKKLQNKKQKRKL